MFTGERSGSGSNFFKINQRNNVTLSSSINFVWDRNPIQGESYWPIRVFMLDLVNIFRILNINSFNKKFIIALVGGFIRFDLLNFMYFFTNTWAANSEIVLFIANMTDFSISWTCASGMWTIARFTVFYKVSFVLVASVTIRLVKFLFKNPINIGGRLRSSNFAGMLMCFLSSMACVNCFRQSEAALSKEPFTKGVIFGTTYNHILD